MTKSWAKSSQRSEQVCTEQTNYWLIVVVRDTLLPKSDLL